MGRRFPTEGMEFTLSVRREIKGLSKLFFLRHFSDILSFWKNVKLDIQAQTLTFERFKS